MFQSRTFWLFGWILFGLCWLLPNHYRPWVNFHSEAMAFAAVASLITGLLLTRSHRGALRGPMVAITVAVIACIPWIQWALGISLFAGDALLTSYFLLGWAAAIFVGYHLAHDDSHQSVLALMHMLWMAALVSAMIGLFQWLKLEDALGIYATQTSVGDRAMGNLAQPNQLATLLLIGIIAYAYIFERHVIGPFAFALGISFLTAVLILTQSRAGMLGVLAVSGFFAVKRPRIASRLRRRQVLAWAVIFSCATALFPLFDRALLLGAHRGQLSTTGDRILIWLQTWEGIMKAPWLGYGWNQTPTAHMAGALKHPGEMTFLYAHNVLLDIVAWNGVPLGLLLIGVGSYWFCTRLARVSGLDATYAMACLLPFSIHSLVEFPFAYAYFLLVAGVFMGVVESATNADSGWRISRRSIGSVLVVWILVGGYMIHEYLLIEEDFRVSQFENLRVGITEPSYQVPDILMFSHMAAMQKASRQRPVPGMTDQQLDNLRRASSRFPHGALALRYALALGLNGDPAGARRMMAVVHATYGEHFYSAAQEVWDEMTVKYPQLGKLD